MNINSRLKHIQNWPELAREAKWSAAALAKRCGVSGDTLRRYFLKHLDKLPSDWLAGQRQHHALELLRDGSSIKEAAACLGYKHQTNFTRKFKAYWGTCPTFQTTVQPTSAKMRDND
jgi:AraC-like DNA-binding protein